jgi:uncharacterized membrane-anchored protein YhcB (DUF1043 family)
MRLQSLRHWHWIAISLLLGVAIGALRTQSAGNLGRFGQTLNSQSRFEQALITTEQGRPRFTDISVHAQTIRDSHGQHPRDVYVVAGSYFNGHYDQRDGKLVAVWQPTFFVAETPYKPTIDLASRGQPDVARQFQSLKNPTVLDFLSALSDTDHITYTHAWWLELGVTSWTLATFLLVGVIVPFAINLMTYGSLLRPPEEKGLDLSQAPAPTPPPANAPALTEADLAAINALEESLAAHATAAAPATATAPAPLKQLATEKLQPAAASTEKPREYGSKPDDYYPTARRAKKT